VVEPLGFAYIAIVCSVVKPLNVTVSLAEPALSVTVVLIPTDIALWSDAKTTGVEFAIVFWPSVLIRA